MLLVIALLAGAVIVFALNAAQGERDRERESARADRDRLAAADRVRADALNAYLKQMSDLLLQQNVLSARSGTQAPRRSAG